MTFSRIIKFFKTYFLKHPWYVVVYGVVFFLKDFKFTAHFYSAEEIINLLSEGKSLIRLGDGEVGLLLDLKNHYHFYSPKLKMMMKKIITSYSSKSPYILSVPRFLNFSNKELQAIGKLTLWLPFKVVFLLMFPKKVSYMDAHNFYYDQYFEDVVAPIFGNKVVMYVTRKETIESLRKNPRILQKRSIFIETPERDALHEYEKIKQTIDRELDGFLPEDVVLFFAMGPVGKYLIYEYSNRGYQGIDVGRGLEVAFTGESIEHLSI